MFDEEKFLDALLKSETVKIVIPGLGETEFSAEEVCKYIVSLKSYNFQIKQMIHNKIVANDNLIKNAEKEIIKREQIIESTIKSNDYLEELIKNINSEV